MRRYLTPRMLSTRSHERPTPRFRAPDPAKLPRLESGSGAELDAAAEWLAHVQAGRIEVK